jgi:hypothetical protein
MRVTAFTLFLIPLFCWAETCIFTPPSGWKPLASKELSKTQIGFAKKGSGQFNPSINLVSELVDCDLKEYLKAVKKVHTSQPNTRWIDLGTIVMKAGVGRLTEIRKPSLCGEIVLLQAIFIQSETAYILTGAVLKNELVSNQKELITSFRSLELVPSIWSAIKDEPLKDQILSYVESENAISTSEWKSFQSIIEKKTSELGAYWQYLALGEAKRRHFE